MSWGSEKPRYDADGPGIIASFSLSAFELIAATVQYERFNVIDSRGIPSAGVLPGTSYMQNKFSVGMMMQSYVGGAVMAIVLVAAALD